MCTKAIDWLNFFTICFVARIYNLYLDDIEFLKFGMRPKRRFLCIKDFFALYTCSRSKEKTIFPNQNSYYSLESQITECFDSSTCKRNCNTIVLLNIIKSLYFSMFKVIVQWEGVSQIKWLFDRKKDIFL